MQKHYYFLFTLLFFLTNCINHEQDRNSAQQITQDLIQLEVNYAKGFELNYEENFIQIITKSFSENAPFKDSIYIPINDAYNIPEEVKILTAEVRKLACQSSTHLAFINTLKSTDLIKGLCGLKYIQNQKVKEIILENGAVELCLTDQIQKEALLKANPDLFFTYPFGGDQNQSYQNSGINTLLIAEYLESNQMARLEWIKLFGVILGKSKEANEYFNQVESSYKLLKTKVIPKEKTFIMNLPFRDTWFMPSATSVGVKTITDAGLNYYYENWEGGTENEMHAKESVWNDGVYSDYWIIVAHRPIGFTLDDLIREEPVYAEFKSVKDKQVVFCNTAEVDYFAQGIMEPNVILKDILFATGQLKKYEPKYFFLLQ